MKEFFKGIKKIILTPVVFVVLLPIILISMIQVLGGAEETLQHKVFKKIGV
jgi:hypothetical protein